MTNGGHHRHIFVVGDIDPSEALANIESIFGAEPPGT